MKTTKLISSVFTISLALILLSCGSSDPSDTIKDNMEEVESAIEKEVEEISVEIEQTIDEMGKEYTSAYICPMQCEGSGSDSEGTCPKCGMDYVKNEDHKSDGHQHEGHNH